MTRGDAICLIVDELNRAEKIHPKWPADRVVQAAIVAEEAGEALKAALDLRPDDFHSKTARVAAFQEELVQTGAMALRALVNLEIG